MSSLMGRQFLLRKESLGAVVALVITHLKRNVFVNNKYCSLNKLNSICIERAEVVWADNFFLL